MYRRKGPEHSDEDHLVDNTDKDNLPTPEGDESSQTRIREETHVIPHPLAKVKRRIIHKATSPKGKLIYWWVTVSCLGVASFLFVLVPLLVERGLNRQDCSDFVGSDNELPYFYRKDTGQLEICRQGELVLEGRLGIGREHFSETKVNVFTLTEATLTITAMEKNCLGVRWLGSSSNELPLMDCYTLGDSHWYGAYEQLVQTWPMNSSQDFLDAVPFLPHDYLSDPSVPLGPVLHPLWLNSDGVGIMVDESVQLHVSLNDSHLCLIARPFELDCIREASENSTLVYTVCLFDTIAQTSRHFLSKVPHSVSTPSPEVFKKPIWSTWAEFKTNLTGTNVNDLCSQIQRHQFNVSQLEIDDGYSLQYGELEFNAQLTVNQSQCESFAITAWVHPFVNYDASTFRQGVESAMFLPGVSQTGSNSVSLVKWWQGYGAVINFLNDTVANSHAEQLMNFLNTGLSSFKFDAGEYTYLPKCVYIEGLSHPAEFTKAYVKFVGNQSYSDRAEVRVGYFTQDQPLFVRLLDRTSSWDEKNGLQSVLNAVLSLGLGGYIFVVPDMIGGNGRIPDSLTSTVKPPHELFIRWAQLNAFLPVMQFSIAPWSYNNQTTNDHVRSLMQLHYSLQFDVLASNSLNSSYPMILPLWWRAVDFNDERTWTISDQFFVGNDYMVAPVLTQSIQRNVYFPLGSNYSVVTSALTAESTCPDNMCVGGTTQTFTVHLYQVLYFRVLN